MNTDIDKLVWRAKSGEAAAMTELGRRLLVGDGVQTAPSDGVKCLEAAAPVDGEAAYLLAQVYAIGACRPRSLEKSIALLGRAAELGWRPAQTELLLLARADDDNWVKAQRTLDLAALLQPPKPRAISEAPRMRVFTNFATPTECEWLIERGRGFLEPGGVYKPTGNNTPSDMRTNTQALLFFGAADVLVGIMRERVARAIGVPVEFFEVSKVLNYKPGEQFAPHADYFTPDTQVLKEELARHGQRVATFLLYLSDDYEGGETEFPLAQTKYRGLKGDALLFLNVGADNQPDPKSAHAGTATTRGQKWVFSQHVRALPINAFSTPDVPKTPLSPDWARTI